MKRYVYLTLIVIALLLVMPLPVLGIWEGSPAPPTGSSAPSSDPASTPAPNSTAGDSFRILDEETGQVVEMTERDFLIGTVANELYPTDHTEAMKAQAVAAYTYYGRQRAAQRAKPDAALQGADFSDVTSRFPEGYTQAGLQERWGSQYDTYYRKISQAVDEVLGQRILYQGEPICAAYHAINNGTTESAEVMWGTPYPYLQSVPSPGDKLSPQYESTASFSAADFAAALTAKIGGLAFGDDPAAWITGTPETSPAGTVTKLTVGGMALTGRQIRDALDLRSACFTIAYRDASFELTVHGFGHGVGMSQYGADYMARQGCTWQEILAHYYPGTTIG